MQFSYRDLPEYGLPFVTPDATEFPALVADIEANPRPIGNWSVQDLSQAAVLLNQSGKAIVTLSFVWRFANPNGETPSSRFTNLGSSTQFDVLSGRCAIVRDLWTFFLPGSRRLLTPDGMFGSNLDVMAPEELPRGGGGMMGGGGGAGGRDRGPATELLLDVVIFEDGTYAGQDEGGLIAQLTDELNIERELAEAMTEALHNGASPGQIFEMLLPVARMHPFPPPPSVKRPHHPRLMRGFVSQSLHKLTYGRESDLQSWLAHVTASTPLNLRPADPLR